MAQYEMSFNLTHYRCCFVQVVYIMVSIIISILKHTLSQIELLCQWSVHVDATATSSKKKTHSLWFLSIMFFSFIAETHSLQLFI